MPSREETIITDEKRCSTLSSRASSVDSSYNIEEDDGHDPQYQDSIQPSLNFSRLAYNLAQFNETYKVMDRKSGSGGQTRRVMAAVRPTCSPDTMKRTLKSVLPITDWLYNYNWKSDFIADLVTGITIAVFQVPQSMGYSLLAHVSPVYGLYSSFFPALIYSFMGSSKHSAIGTFAIVSLMTGSVITDMNASNANPIINQTLINGSTTPGSVQRQYSNIQMASMIALLIGIYQLLFGIFRMGFV
ncbi:unnamed protein product, partial [Oppiella nova]